MLPAAGYVLLSFALSILFGNNSSQSVALLSILQLVMMIVAVVVAYILIADPPNAPHLPGILGEIQNERHGKSAPPPSSSSSDRPKQQQRPVQRHPLERFIPTSGQPIKVANVLSVKEAAVYMGMNPDEIMALIDAGKLPAARDSSGFRIARSVLDELKNPASPVT